MKMLVFAVGVASCISPALVGSALAQSRPDLTNGLVFDRDYSFLADPAKRTDLWDPVKYIPLGNDSYVSFSGEERLRYEDFFENPAFGIQAPSKDDYLLERSMLGADLHLGHLFRSFIQLSYTDVYGKTEPVGPNDRSLFEFQQAFVDVTPATDWTIRAGRQEISLGSQRLVSYREGPNIRQSFDGVRVLYVTGNWNITSFFTHPVRTGLDSFSDASNLDQTFWGVYATAPIPAAQSTYADFYLLHLDRKDAIFAKGIGYERRNSYGVRYFNSRQALDYNFEAVFQDGRFGSAHILAWTLASDTGYSFSAPWSPRLGLNADIASGDKGVGDSKLGTFNALFPRGAYFTENGLVGPANFIDLQPNMTLHPFSSLGVLIGVDDLWRESVEDAVYKQPNVPIPGTAGNPHRHTGIETFITPSWQIDPHLSLTSTFVWFEVDKAIRAAGGRNDGYWGTWLAYRF